MLPLWQEIEWKFDFTSNMHTWKNILVHFKKICHLSTGLCCLWNIVSVEKIWTFVDYISLCLIGHVTIWVRFVSTKGGILEYLLSTMWSFWHQWIFQLEKARKLHFLWFWGMTSSSANEITCFFSIFLLHFHN